MGFCLAAKANYFDSSYDGSSAALGRTESYGEVSEGYDFPQKRSLISWKDFLESGPREYMEYSK